MNESTTSNLVIRPKRFLPEDTVNSKNDPLKTPQPPLQSDPLHIWSALLAGWGSAAISSVLCAPLDLVRTRVQVWGQVHGSSSAKAIPAMVQEIIRKEGILGCFRGLGATLITVPAFWSVYFPLYDYWKRLGTKSGTMQPAMVHMTAAVSAGAVADLLCNPLFVVRTRLQTEALHQMNTAAGVARKSNMRQTVLSLYREGGILIFWRGMAANLLGLAHVGVQFPVYEALKRKFRGDRPKESSTDVLLASAISKMTASLLTYPHEVLRSRMMDARMGTQADLLSVGRHLFRTQGFAGFYAGLPVTLVRVIPNTCITFVMYEWLVQKTKQNLATYFR